MYKPAANVQKSLNKYQQLISQKTGALWCQGMSDEMDEKLFK